MGLNMSESFSLRGFDLKKWLTGNKEATKLIIGGVLGFCLLQPELAGYIVAAGGATFVLTKVMDFVNFYISEVDLSD